jgi:plasmid stability protein
MKQLKVSLPDDLRAQLDATSAKNGQSVAEEIRSRVEASFAQEAVDKPLRDLLENVTRLAAEIERERGAAWHKHAGAHELLTLAIAIWLGELKPAGPTAFDANWPHATVFGNDPHQLAALIVHRIRNDPNFTNSATRRWMEDEHQRSFFTQERWQDRLGPPPPPGQARPPTLVGSASSQQHKKDEGQQKPDQPKKRGK